jgi:hydrogenase maturation protease
VIAADTVAWGLEPGTIRVMDYSELKLQITAKNSLHQVSFCETLGYAEMLGRLPARVTIVGIQPADISPWGTELDKRLRRRFPLFCACILEEIAEAGGTYAAQPPQLKHDRGLTAGF